MIALTSIIARYQAKFRSQYRGKITRQQIRAIDAVMDCRTARYGSLALGCDDCDQQSIQYHACGNRACHRPDGRPATLRHNPMAKPAAAEAAASQLLHGDIYLAG